MVMGVSFVKILFHSPNYVISVRVVRYGRKHSDETKKKISEKNKGKLPPNTKKVEIDGKAYQSATQDSRELGVVPATIINRIRSDNFPTYKYLES